MKLILACAVACLATAATNAATYYVSTQGNNGQPGTAAKPFATLQYAVNIAAPGDTILVTTGTYVGCRIETSGGQNLPKTLQAAPGASVLINKPGPGNKHNSIVEVENFGATVTDWVISGFEVANSPKYGIDVRVTNRITVENNHVHNSALTGIFTAFSDHVLTQNNET